MSNDHEKAAQDIAAAISESLRPFVAAFNTEQSRASIVAAMRRTLDGFGVESAQHVAVEACPGDSAGRTATFQLRALTPYGAALIEAVRQAQESVG